MILWIAVLACANGDEMPVKEGPQEWDPNTPTDDPAPSDTDTSAPLDTDEPQDTGEVQDSGGTSTDQVCYPGPTGDWSVCYPLVPYNPGWGADYEYPAPLGGDPQYGDPDRFIDLSKVPDPDASLAPNFVFDEFMQEWKGRYGLFQPHMVVKLQDLRDDLGPLAVNSGYRNPEYNAGVGGVTYSRHQWGDAVDLDPVSVSLDQLGSACSAADADYVGYYESHIHCDWRNHPLDPEFYDPEPTQPGHEHSRAPLPELHVQLARSFGVWTAPAEGWDEGEPLREWTAYDADGQVLSQQVGRHFSPPAEAAQVEVVVGRAMTLRQSL